jgi:hypothetical protein
MPKQGHPLGQARKLEQAARNLEQGRKLGQAPRKLEQARRPVAARAAALSMQDHRQRLRLHQLQPRLPHPDTTDRYRRNTPNYCAGRSSSQATVRSVSCGLDDHAASPVTSRIALYTFITFVPLVRLKS